MEGIFEGIFEAVMEGVTEDCVHRAETAHTCFPLAMAGFSVVGCIAFGSQDWNIAMWYTDIAGKGRKRWGRDAP